jgi:hypothetical protein
MATKKKPAAKKAPAKKAPAKKPAHRKATTTSHEDKLAASALKLVDEAAALLRKGIVTGSSTTERTREDAKKRAHVLLNKASVSLGDLLSGSTSALRKVINKI